ncbi:MAG: hypothetical protein P1V97_15150 [Planctomycetota bacterium]|nr:hypothetical protein [Planctomycetota bacterium]
MEAETLKPGMTLPNEVNTLRDEGQVKVKSNRCPYCHDDVESEGSDGTKAFTAPPVLPQTK